MELQRILMNALVHEGHVYLEAGAPVCWIWLGRKEHVDALGPQEALLLIRYRIAFERAYCLTVH